MGKTRGLLPRKKGGEVSKEKLGEVPSGEKQKKWEGEGLKPQME